MPEPIDETRFRAQLPAYVDRELDSESRLHVVEYLAAHPEAIREVAELEQLRHAVAHSFRRQAPEAPEGLARKIAQMTSVGAVAELAPPDVHGRISPWRISAVRISPWLAAAAACILVACGVAAGIYLRPSSVNPSSSANETAGNETASPFTATLVSGLTNTHVGCSRLVHHENLKARADAGPLPVALQQFANGHPGVPDLTSMGYTFEGADPCPVPGGTTMHMVYRATGGALEDTISVFVQTDQGQVSIAADRIYIAADGSQPHPILIWRTGGMVYYVVGDAMDTIQNAAKALRGKASL